jgi:hypothetical protein
MRLALHPSRGLAGTAHRPPAGYGSRPSARGCSRQLQRPRQPGVRHACLADPGVLGLLEGGLLRFGRADGDHLVAARSGGRPGVVAETKGSLSTLQLKGIEDAKIECARKFFATLNERRGHGVKYDVVTDYTELMQIVAG